MHSFIVDTAGSKSSSSHHLQTELTHALPVFVCDLCGNRAMSLCCAAIASLVYCKTLSKGLSCVTDLNELLHSGFSEKRLNPKRPFIPQSTNGMRWAGQEIILRLTTVPAGYTGGNAFRHLSHVINQLWKQQISVALQSVIIQWCLTLEASTSGLAFANTKTESNDRLRDELHWNLITNHSAKAPLLQKCHYRLRVLNSCTCLITTITHYHEPATWDWNSCNGVLKQLFMYSELKHLNRVDI